MKGGESAMLLCMTSANSYETNHDDRQLESCIVRLAQDDRKAFAILYEQTRACIYGFALSILKNTHDAEDILQDCYIAVCSAAKNYRPCGKPMAWIFTIARNLCLMKQREYRRTGTIPDENWETSFQEKEDLSPEDKLILTECMQTLTDEERQIVVLHAVGGFKHREIAGMLNLPLPTVLSKHSRALKKLKAHFI